MKLPKYKCHKEVGALKIDKLVYTLGDSNNPDGCSMVHFVKKEYSPIEISAEYIDKHDPKPGGYYIVYADGYESWSPGPVFENGYTLID